MLWLIKDTKNNKTLSVIKVCWRKLTGQGTFSVVAFLQGRVTVSIKSHWCETESYFNIVLYKKNIIKSNNGHKNDHMQYYNMNEKMQ